MPKGTPYDPAVKKRIIAATQSARSGGKSWKEAFAAAKGAGYKGTQGGLVQMMLSASGKKARPKGGKRGRPAVKKGSSGKAARGSSIASLLGGRSLDALVEKLVAERVRETVDRMMGQLQKARR